MSEKRNEFAAQLPFNWVSVRVGDFLSLANGFAFKPSHWHPKGLPIIRIQNLNNSKAPFNFCSDNIPDRFRVNSGDILFAWSGTPGTSFGAHIWKGGQAWLNQHIFKVGFNKELLNARFLQLAINQNLAAYIAAAHGGAGLAHITKGKFEQSTLRVAPLNEQQRIVAEIDKQFSRMDNAVAGLKRVQGNLRRYRASVLKAACEGHLVPTEAELARKEGRDYEPAGQLLNRILVERRSKWESDQFQNMVADNKPPKNDEWKGKYPRPVFPQTSGLPELPEGWIWASIDQIAECLDGRRIPINKEERAKRIGDVPYYGANGRVGWIDDFLFDEPLILVVEDETFVGRTIPFSYLITGRAWVNNHAHVLRPTRAVVPAYLNHSLMFYPFTPLTTGSTGRRKLTQGALMAAPYPLPPKEEQVRIVSTVERLISTVDNVFSISDARRQTATVLRNAVLRNAFLGRLVPQDPNDEPVSLLLDQIRSERVRARATRDKDRKTNCDSPLDNQRLRRVKGRPLTARPGRG